MPTTAASQLQIYNDALKLCEERLLASTSEARKPRYLLDDVWNGGGIDACLEESDWDFARRTIAATYDPSIQPSFGYQHAFQHPPDWLRTSGISPDPYFETVLTRYSDEGGYWYADIQTIYVKYVSNDANYGKNYNLMPQSFQNFVAAYFANQIVGVLTHDKQIQAKVEQSWMALLKNAKSKDALNEPPGFFPRGSWTRARQGSQFGRPTRNSGVY